MKSAEELKKISKNTAKQREEQEEKNYIKVIHSGWFSDIMRDIENKAVIAAKEGKHGMLLSDYQINRLNDLNLPFELDFLQRTFSRYFSHLGYKFQGKIYPIFNYNGELIYYYFTGKIFW